ncbi:MAG: VTT domain-containing protein [Aigarchaeota archaeon]|nr:VTT domain-containing protein [Candidatus Wolframiiraptor gerlachensis]
MSGLLDSLLEWARLHLVPLGIPGLILTAFTESSFFPIPPDVILIPLALLDPGNAVLYGLVATVSSTAGALLGYWIGLKGGRPILLKLAGKKSVKKAEEFFNRYGAWAVGVAAFTPIPYKVFTIASGVFMLRNLKAFILASILGRGGRFMAEAVLIMLFGEEILSFLSAHFELITILVGAAVIFFLAVYSLLRRRSRS